MVVVVVEYSLLLLLWSSSLDSSLVSLPVESLLLSRMFLPSKLVSTLLLVLSLPPQPVGHPVIQQLGLQSR